MLGLHAIVGEGLGGRVPWRIVCVLLGNPVALRGAGNVGEKLVERAHEGIERYGVSSDSLRGQQAISGAFG